MTSTLRRALGAAVRWRYLTVNPAVDVGKNPQPRSEELLPFTSEEIDALALELGATYGPLVVFAADTGLRTNEWVALERRDVDRAGKAVAAQRRYADGVLTPFTKTARSRRRVPLATRALRAPDELPPRVGTPLVFPAAGGRHRPRHLADTGVVRRLSAAGIEQRGPYQLRRAVSAVSNSFGVFRSIRVLMGD